MKRLPGAPRRPFVRVLAVVLAVAAGATLTGCSVPLVSSEGTPQALAVIDTSGSTIRNRRRAVECASEVKFSSSKVPNILCWLAESLDPNTIKAGAVSVLWADGQTYSEPEWPVDEFNLKETSGYKELSDSARSVAEREELQKKAALDATTSILSELKNDAQSQGRGGSDLSAVMKVIGRRAATLDGPVTVKMFTDGGANVAELKSLLHGDTSPATAEKRITKILDKLESTGELPELENASGEPITFEFTGLGYRARERNAPGFLEDFWTEYVERAGGTVQQGSQSGVED